MDVIDHRIVFTLFGILPIRDTGRANMTMPWFEDAESLRKAVQEATISGELSGLYVHMVSTFARFAKKFNR